MTTFERPRVLEGRTFKMRTGHGNLFMTVNFLEGKPVEVFAVVGKCGKSILAKTEAIGRLVSLCLQEGVEVTEVIKQLKGIAGEQPLAEGKGVVLSIPDAIGKLLEEVMKGGESDGNDRLSG